MAWTREGSLTSTQRGRGDRPLPGTVARPKGTGGEATRPVLGLFRPAAASSRSLGIRGMRRGRPRNEDVQTYRLVWGTGTKVGWQLTTNSLSEVGRKLFQSGLIVAGLGPYCPTTTTMRHGRGAISLQALHGFDTSGALIWKSIRHGAKAAEAPVQFSSEPGDCDKPIPVRELIKVFEDNSRKLEKYCIVQFLGIESEDVEEVRQRFPDLPLMAGRELPPQIFDISSEPETVKNISMSEASPETDDMSQHSTNPMSDVPPPAPPPGGAMEVASRFRTRIDSEHSAHSSQSSMEGVETRPPFQPQYPGAPAAASTATSRSRSLRGPSSQSSMEEMETRPPNAPQPPGAPAAASPASSRSRSNRGSGSPTLSEIFEPMTEGVLNAMHLIQQTMSNPTSCSTSRSRSLRGESPHPQSRTLAETLNENVSVSSAATQPYEDASSLVDTEPYGDVASSRSRVPPRVRSRTLNHPTVDQEGPHSQNSIVFSSRFFIFAPTPVARSSGTGLRSRSN